MRASWERVLGGDVSPKTRAYRARWILALDEAARLGRPATWEEWNRIWFGRERTTFEAAKRALVRLKAELLELGVSLEAAVDGEVWAGAREVRDLFEPWVLRAREISERLEAQREKRSEWLESRRLRATRVRAEEVVAAAEGGGPDSDRETIQAAGPRPYEWLERRFGIGRRRVRYLLRCRQADRSPTRRKQIEDERTAGAIERALGEFDQGGTVRDVAAVLECAPMTARSFLLRHGRTPMRRRGSPQ